MATATAPVTKTPSGPRLWLQALYTIPRVDPGEVDILSRWLILGRVSVVVMTAISAVIGGLLAVRDDVFDPWLLVLVAIGLILAHTGSNLVNDFWDFQHGIDHIRAEVRVETGRERVAEPRGVLERECDIGDRGPVSHARLFPMLDGPQPASQMAFRPI